MKYAFFTHATDIGSLRCMWMGFALIWLPSWLGAAG